MTGAPLYDPSSNFRGVEHAGETPLSRVSATLDHLGAPGGGQLKLTAPADMSGAKVYAVQPVGAAAAGLVDHVPTTPILGTAATSAELDDRPR